MLISKFKIDMLEHEEKKLENCLNISVLLGVLKSTREIK